MEYTLADAYTLLGRTPKILDLLLQGLEDSWLKANEGPETWSAFDVLGHLIHGEETDWIPRARLILSDAENKTFVPFDRFAHLEKNADKSIRDLLEAFKIIREKNIQELHAFNIQEQDLNKSGWHPELGPVSLKQLLSAWVVHDLGHLAQISRVMAKQYKDEVGPWVQFMKILNS
jgi:hypothetical protein